jgi:hypothetical protein
VLAVGGMLLGRMSLLPQSKSQLREYVETVHDLVERRKGKLPHFKDNQVRALLDRGYGEVVMWTMAANREFRHMEMATGLPFHDQTRRGIGSEQLPREERSDDETHRPSFWNFSPNDDGDFSEEY